MIDFGFAPNEGVPFPDPFWNRAGRTLFGFGFPILDSLELESMTKSRSPENKLFEIKIRSRLLCGRVSASQPFSSTEVEGAGDHIWPGVNFFYNIY